MIIQSLFSLSAVASLALSFSLVACGSAPSSESVGHTGQASTAADPAFTACFVDSDCVAIAQAGCCQNGWLVTVSSSSVDDYEAANACTAKPICPQYMVNDTRVASCDATSNTCVLIQPAVATTTDDAGAGEDAGEDAGDDACVN